MDTLYAYPSFISFFSPLTSLKPWFTITANVYLKHDDDGKSNTGIGSNRELPGGEREAAATYVNITPESSD